MDSILDQACIGLISPLSYYTLFSPLSRRCPFQDKHKQKNRCILKTLSMFPAIRGNHYVIDRHGYPPYYFSSFGGWWMSGCMDKSMLILISLWHRLISSWLYSVFWSMKDWGHFLYFFSLHDEYAAIYHMHFFPWLQSSAFHRKSSSGLRLLMDLLFFFFFLYV